MKKLTLENVNDLKTDLDVINVQSPVQIDDSEAMKRFTNKLSELHLMYSVNDDTNIVVF